MPVALPPGRARLATRPTLTGSSGVVKTIGMVVDAALAAEWGERLFASDRDHDRYWIAGGKGVLQGLIKPTVQLALRIWVFDGSNLDLPISP
jgi:hypothetical protein